MVNSTTFIRAYVGARPGGRAPPDLRGVPVSSDPNFGFTFVLAFARDGNRDGIFTPFWDDSITPTLVAELQQENANRGFAVSLGGDNWDWQAPADEAGWISNAVSSLLGMKNTYNLSGFDLDYENGIDDSFPRIMGQVIDQLNETPTPFGVQFSVAPFGSTYDTYQAIYTNNSSFVPQFNYQIYADGLGDVQSYIDRYAVLAQANPQQNDNGYFQLGFGICTTMGMERGLQPPQIYDAWDAVHSEGVSVCFIWCLEDSFMNGYAVESEIQQRS
jgi:hypothetical protein